MIKYAGKMHCIFSFLLGIPFTASSGGVEYSTMPFFIPPKQHCQDSAWATTQVRLMPCVVAASNLKQKKAITL